MDVPIYRFDDGWEIRRVLEPASIQALLGRERHRNASIFGLYDMLGQPRSVIGLWRRPGEDDFHLSQEQSILTPKGIEHGPKMDRYWLPFITDSFGIAYASDMLATIIEYPDALHDRLQAVDEDRLRFLIDLTLGARDAEDMINQLGGVALFARDAAERAFQGVTGFEVLPPRIETQTHYATIFIPENGHVLLISANVSGWTMTPGESGLIEEATTLHELWNDYVKMVNETEWDKLVRSSQAPAWWRRNSHPGEELYDLEPYHLLDAPPPFALPDNEFKEWIQAGPPRVKPSTDPMLYHGTSQRKLHELLATGGTMTAPSWWGSQEVAWYYAEDQEDRDGSSPVVIGVPLSRFDTAHLEPDHNSIAEPITTVIGKTEDEVIEAWETAEGTWQESLDIVESVIYRAPIQVTDADVTD
jgi:hypothetical protein